MSHSGVLHILRRVLMLLGVRKVQFYNLNRTFVTLTLQSGVDMKTVSGILGRYSAGFTLDTYPYVTTAAQKTTEKIINILKKLKSDMSPAKRAVWREGTAEDPELVPMRVKIWISSQWPKINRQKSCNHNHRPCRWFAQAPLGPITSRAYRLITELPLHGAPCRYLNSGGVLLIFISKTSPPFYPSFFTNSSLRSDIFSGHS